METIQSPFGHTFEEFTVGTVFKHWPGKTINTSEQSMFCLLTMVHHPVHLDEQYASETQHGKILVVGTYVISLIAGMSVRDISGKAIANLEYEKIVHNAPVFIGDTLRAETEILEKIASKSKPDRGIIYVETRGFNQRNEKVLTFRRKLLVPKTNVEGV
ncbi:MAG: MaoC family dehydratase [bacterium]|nr:MaoC family dehydratase [bacterium]